MRTHSDNQAETRMIMTVRTNRGQTECRSPRAISTLPYAANAGEEPTSALTAMVKRPYGQEDGMSRPRLRQAHQRIGVEARSRAEEPREM